MRRLLRELEQTPWLFKIAARPEVESNGYSRLGPADPEGHDFGLVIDDANKRNNTARAKVVRSRRTIPNASSSLGIVAHLTNL